MACYTKNEFTAEYSFDDTNIKDLNTEFFKTKGNRSQNEMKYLKLLSFLLLIIILIGCDNSTMVENSIPTEDNQQGYIDRKIAFQEAQEVLSIGFGITILENL